MIGDMKHSNFADIIKGIGAERLELEQLALETRLRLRQPWRFNANRLPALAVTPSLSDQF